MVYTKVLIVKLSEKQFEELRRRSSDLSMSMSEYVRSKIFDPDEISWKELKAKLKRWLVEEE